LNLVGKTNLGELGWLLKHARVVITNDSGPAHLAAAAGSTVVTIFGRTTLRYGPTRWRPLTDKGIIVTEPIARKYFESRDSYWRRCFAAITVEAVAAAVREALCLEANK
jgi:heptosyltransferase-3